MSDQDQKRQWSERDLTHLTRSAMEIANEPVYEQLAYLAEGMRRILGDGDDPKVPEVLRRKGVLKEIQEQAEANAIQGRGTDQKLTAFIEEQRSHNGTVDQRMGKMETGQHRIRRTVVRCCKWTIKRTTEGKLIWHRIATGGTILLVAGHRIYLWTPVLARKVAAIAHSLYP